VTYEPPAIERRELVAALMLDCYPGAECSWDVVPTQ
jgi:hypothetical protein